MIQWWEVSDSMGFLGLNSSCGRFRIRPQYGIPDFRWCLWDSERYRNSRPRGTPSRTLESAKEMAQLIMKEVKE